MTREIKFRAWDGKYWYGFNFETFAYATANTMNRILAQENTVVCQFTGLKDKNGREIYEGDKVRRGELGVSVIGFEQGAFVLLEGENEPLSHYNHEDWEVIGNIYENPDLLSTL